VLLIVGTALKRQRMRYAVVVGVVEVLIGPMSVDVRGWADYKAGPDSKAARKRRLACISSSSSSVQ
jgi:hypothetical protein